MKPELTKKQITLLWIPGHTGIKGNKMADKHAKITTLSKNTILLELIPYGDIKFVYKNQ
jgi:ribonuclease HI